MAKRYINLYKSSSDLPGRLAKQIEVPSSNGNPNPSLSATLQSMQSSIDTLNSSVRILKSENETLKAEMQQYQKDMQHMQQYQKDMKDMQQYVQALKSENEALQQEMDTFRQDLTAITRKLRILAAMEDVLVRKLLENCRKKCKRALTAAKIQFPANDWNEVLDNPSCQTLLTSLGLRRDYGLQATRYGPAAHMKQKGDKAAHVITEDRRLYAEVVCSKEGFERQSLVEIYKFVFENQDPELEIF